MKAERASFAVTLMITDTLYIQSHHLYAFVRMLEGWMDWMGLLD